MHGWTLVAVAGLVTSACSGAAASSPLTNVKGSKEAVARAAFAALEARDAGALQALRITRNEYESLLWPEMPDREQMPFDFAWSMNDAVSRKGLRQALERWGGLGLELVSFEFEEEPEVYASFTLHRGAKVVARRRDTGESGVIASFDVLIEFAGGWKLMDFDEL